MNDSREIENLIYTYAERIDAGDLSGVAGLFRYAEMITPAVSAQGYDEILKIYKNATRIYSDTGTPKTRHLTSNVIININGSSAETRSCYTVFQATDDLPLQAIVGGRYMDMFLQTNGAWVFKRREITVDLLGDCSAHLLYSL